MLLRRTDDQAHHQGIAIAQPAHAWLSGLMARAWGNARFAPPAPAPEVELAAALHDIGWLDWEETAHLDPATGLPRVFADVPAEEHAVLWRRGVRHVCGYSTYAALLVSLHGDTIYEKTFDAATARPEAASAVRAFLDEQHGFQRRTIARLRRDPRWHDATSEPSLGANKRLLAAVDTMSLNICWGVARTVVVTDAPMSPDESVAIRLEPDGDRGIIVDPWPFAAASLELPLEGRPLRGPFGDDRALADALASSEPVTLDTTLRARRM